jgi:hypothetical protein
VAAKGSRISSCRKRLSIIIFPDCAPPQGAIATGTPRAAAISPVADQ